MEVPTAGPDTAWHGLLAQVDWEKPHICADSDQAARPGYNTCSAAEFLDSPTTLRKKVRLLAQMLRKSRKTVVYTGAGISTASGTPDYASKAKHSHAPHRVIGARPDAGNRLEAQPTYSHHMLAALQRAGHVHHWLQQNHDRLAQKAGFPQSKINEIHGAWGDHLNRVKMMDDDLRADLGAWMQEWEDKAELCLALGTSLCGMTADCVALACARRAWAAATNAGEQGGARPTSEASVPSPQLMECAGSGDSSRHGLVIINLQATPLDALSSLRIYGVLDDVMKLLAVEMRVRVPHKTCLARGKEWQSMHPRCHFNTPRRKTSQLKSKSNQ